MHLRPADYDEEDSDASNEGQSSEGIQDLNSRSDRNALRGATGNDPISPVVTGDSSGLGTQAVGATGSQNNQPTGPPPSPKKRNPRPLASHDPKSVRKKLRSFYPKANREKITDLRNECINLEIGKTPLAFCFLLRSMFEISAKLWVSDHPSSGISSVDPRTGQEKTLASLLQAICDFLKKNPPPGQTSKEIGKRLHGPMAVLNADSPLSVISMNQLVHNPNYFIVPNDVCVLFHQVLPLLEDLNS